MALIEKIFNPLSSFHHKRISRYLCELDIEKIIDVGAHKGEFLEEMLKIEKVNFFYAFEPQKNIFNELSEKFSKNKKVSLFNYAMDKEITKKKLKINNKFSYYIKVADFYYKKSAKNMSNRIKNEVKLKNIQIIELTKTNYRLLLGPFDDIQSLKDSFEKMNSLYFENLEIIKDV